MNLDHGIGPVLPRPSYCGAAAAVSFCVVSLAAACAGGFYLVARLIDHFTRGNP